MKAMAWGFSLMVAAGCVGVAVDGEPSDDESGGTSGSGGAVAGTVGTGGRVEKGGSPGYGGAVCTGGAPGKGGSAGKGGGTALGGTSGVGGAADGGDPGDGTTGCRFEPLPEGRRCENAGSRVQDDTSKRISAATSLAECESACRSSPVCTAVTDYFSEVGVDKCYLRRGSCNVVGTDVSAEEDAAKYYNKVCDSNGACRLEYLGHWLMCKDAGTYTEVTTASSRADCDDACLADPTCSGVRDLFWIEQIVGCYVYNSTCDAPEELPFGDSGRTYRKVCDL